ncbi:MAG: LuxR C-terminal-related transcriptional regulator [Trueperaceae bacterium]
MTAPLSVGVVEDHPLFRRALERLVHAQGWSLVFSCEDLESAGAALRTSGPDVVVLDLQLPDGSGLELLGAAGGTRFLVVSSWDDVATVKEVERAGGRGLVSKSAEDGAIAAAIRDVAAGRTAFAPARQPAAGATEASAVLSGRELECLVLVAEGLSNREIGDVLGIGTETVKSHVGAILQKLAAKDRAQAVAFAFRRGLI